MIAPRNQPSDDRASAARRLSEAGWPSVRSGLTVRETMRSLRSSTTPTQSGGSRWASRIALMVSGSTTADSTYRTSPRRATGTRTAKVYLPVSGLRNRLLIAGSPVRSTASKLPRATISGRPAPKGRSTSITCRPDGAASVIVSQFGWLASTWRASSWKARRSSTSSRLEVARASRVLMVPLSVSSTAVRSARVRSVAPRSNVARSRCANRKPAPTAKTIIGSSVPSIRTRRWERSVITRGCAPRTGMGSCMARASVR